ncbi:MAG: hypothetical protein JXX29_15480 [Deltaproteobacteria bacterium]|nr:hypothetical protein [Deltaproteobacteria bacterium]MBN2673084.1 hypothetical protein [Deltaproteobacteria bacterium]
MTLKTVIVLGVARSGTSMVAKVLAELGVFMGSERNNVVYEDTEIAALMEEEFDKKKLKDLIHQRNAAHSIWGFKRPPAVRYIHKFEKYFTNVHYVIPFRDIMAISQRNVLSMEIDAMKSIKLAIRRNDELMQFVRKVKRPCFLFSYEKAITKKQKFVSGLAEFLDISLAEEALNNALNCIQPDDPQYLDSSRRNTHMATIHASSNNILGNLGGIQFQKEAYGWARCIDSDEPVVLHIWVNQNKVAEILADQFREDLQSRFSTNGKHGFRFDLSSVLSPGIENVVRVFANIEGENIELSNSPQTVF